MRRIVEVLY